MPWRPSLSHFRAANIEVESCRETVARGESKTARVSAAPRALDPGTGTHWKHCRQQERPRAIVPMPHCIGGSPIAGSPPPSAWVEAVPWHHRKQEASLSALSRPPCRFQTRHSRFGVMGFAAARWLRLHHSSPLQRGGKHASTDHCATTARRRRWNDAPPVVRHHRVCNAAFWTMANDNAIHQLDSDTVGQNRCRDRYSSPFLVQSHPLSISHQGSQQRQGPRTRKHPQRPGNSRVIVAYLAPSLISGQPRRQRARARFLKE